MRLVLGRSLRRAAYRVLQVWWFVRRPETHGVKLVLRSGDDVLFVRHTYGDRDSWELPGGGRRRHESARDAARREAREELGVDLNTWRPFGVVVHRARATAHLTFLHAGHDGGPIALQLAEIAEFRWCQPDRPPEPLGEHARAGLALPGFPPT